MGTVAHQIWIYLWNCIAYTLCFKCSHSNTKIYDQGENSLAFRVATWQVFGLLFKCLSRHKNMSCFNDLLPKKHFFYDSHGLPKTLWRKSEDLCLCLFQKMKGNCQVRVKHLTVMQQVKIQSFWQQKDQSIWFNVLTFRKTQLNCSKFACMQS